ncbi:hypothetical protein AAMO2058_001612000 [Amorphochlora amoebiformis]
MLGNNVHFHRWCLHGVQERPQGTSNTSQARPTSPPRAFKTLPEIVRELNHTDRPIYMLKLDCEGCEWDALPHFAREMPAKWREVEVLYLELHVGLVTPEAVGAAQVGELSRLVRDDFGVMFLDHNMETSKFARRKRFQVDEQLVRNGL